MAVVNEALARRAFGGADPVGQRVYAGGNPVPWEIIGLLADVRQKWLDPEPQPELFVPVAQILTPGSRHFGARAATPRTSSTPDGTPSVPPRWCGAARTGRPFVTPRAPCTP